MKGTMIKIAAQGTVTYTPIDREPALETLKDAIGGGYLELVPGWTQFLFDNGTLQPCVAFCDEDGKRKALPVNNEATLMWHNILSFSPTSYLPDILLGDVVVLTGDAAFMRSLSDDGDDDAKQ